MAFEFLIVVYELEFWYPYAYPDPPVGLVTITEDRELDRPILFRAPVARLVADRLGGGAVLFKSRKMIITEDRKLDDPILFKFRRSG